MRYRLLMGLGLLISAIWLIGQTQAHALARPAITPTASDTPTATITATGTASGSSATPTATVIGSTASATITASPIITPGSVTATAGTATATSTPDPLCGRAWRPVPIPDGGGLYGIAVVAPDDVWVGGSAGALQHWNGLGWTAAPLPTTTAGPAFVSALSAGGPGDIWALTQALGGQLFHRSGGGWAAVPYPTPTGAYLADLSAFSPSSAWAVGSSEPMIKQIVPLVEYWDGHTWTTVTTPPSTGWQGGGPLGYELRQVQAVGPGEAWAIGGGVFTMPSTNLLLHCTPAGCTASRDFNATALAASGPADVWTAADAYPGGTDFHHWNGSTWTLVPGPSLGGRVTAMTVLSPTDAWALGDSGFAHWDGQIWTLVSQPPALLQELAGSGTGDVWAVGQNTGAVNAVGVVQRYGPALAFADVATGSPFLAPIDALACRTILGGYTCGGAGEPCDSGYRPYFRPANLVTRGQTAKIVSLATGLPGTPTGQHFSDVPPSNVFYLWIEQMAAAGILSGYTCGTVAGEPCDSGRRPYFRPTANVTRGQLAKIIALAGGYSNPPSGQTFADVRPDNVFYRAVEQIAGRGIISGYTCGSTGEPCDGNRRPYYRPGVTASRGQSAKIINQAFPAP